MMKHSLLLQLKYKFFLLVYNIVEKSKRHLAVQDKLVLESKRIPALRKKTMERPIVIVASGENCLIHFDAIPEFEICSYSYTESVPNKILEKYAERHYSFRSEGMGESLSILDRLIELEHEYIVVIPDDILLSISQLNLCFHVARSFCLDLFQPALSLCSYYTWTYLLARPSSILREVPTIEQPLCFSNKAWKILRGSFTASKSFYGLDQHVWPVLCKINNLKIAVIDAVVCKHCKPVESGDKILSTGLTAREEQDFVKANIQTILANLSTDDNA